MQKIPLAELMSMPVSELPLKTQNDAWFDGTKHMHAFSEEVMIPLLRTQVGVKPHEAPVRDIYFRMHLFLETMVALNNYRHFQSVAAAARSLFELWIDLEIVARDGTGNAATEFHEFPEFERFRVAGEVVQFAKANPGVLADVSLQQAFYDDPARQTRFAGMHKSHWSGKKLPRRVKAVGAEPMYIETYPILSWYVHAGATGTSGMSREALERVFGFSHSIAQRVFTSAVATCAKFMKISSVDYFAGWMESISLKTGELITQEQIKVLEARRAAAKP